MMKNFKINWPKRSTPEDLEMSRMIHLVINYGSHVIAISSDRGYGFYAAIYDRGLDFTPFETIYSCEDEIFMNHAITESFPDEGHAIKAAMEYIK